MGGEYEIRLVDDIQGNLNNGDQRRFEEPPHDLKTALSVTPA